MVCLLDAHRDHARDMRFETPSETTPTISMGTYIHTLAIVFAASSRHRAM